MMQGGEECWDDTAADGDDGKGGYAAGAGAGEAGREPVQGPEQAGHSLA